MRSAFTLTKSTCLGWSIVIDGCVCVKMEQPPQILHPPIDNEQLTSPCSDLADPMEDQFTKLRKEKKERISKNELQRLRNIARNMKGKGSYFPSKIQEKLVA